MPPFTRPATALLSAALLTGALVGCGSSGVAVPGTETLDAADRQACTDLLESLGTELGTLSARAEPDLEAGTAVFGDPSSLNQEDDVTVVCGAVAPDGLEATSACDAVQGVGWYTPTEQLDDPGGGAVSTTVEFSPRVSVVFPATERGDAGFSVLTALAAPVKEHLERVTTCK
ncbi:DUF3515 family protein [Nocardioides bruguierae]|uniref:DUF3515 domain-containing protein n=1 Tax=Nocardioides bruguierae TaxID=2945102 RepID=A0A9X2D5F3_9ACTN|nr:DUF3515 family protein [Nocardioides bruguierae]MCL8026591.1 DUF3515 domain-containing protein [Nocardioides bruguierae]MCM0619676.1 DUF3515 domain-containing protein [Nocardioides bruguierae]